MPPITREALIEVLRTALEPLPYVDGAWVGGSAAFGALDEYSDVDLNAFVADDSIERAFTVVEAALDAYTPIAIRYETPNTTGYIQRVYSFQNAPEFLIVEAALIPRSSTNRFLERELHGEPVVLFDKLGVVYAIPLDRDADLAVARQRLAKLKSEFQIFQHLIKKATFRGNAAEAFLFYQAFTLRRFRVTTTANPDSRA
jgi:hypothetical protein